MMIKSWIKSYPIPLWAITGLLVGAVVYFGFRNPSLAEKIWYVTLIIGAVPILYHTIKGMLQGKFALDIVAMLAIIAAVWMQQAFAGVVIVLMQSGGEALESFGLKRASSSLDALLARAPRIARRKKGNGLEEIVVELVKIGDILIVRPGDLIPVDGTIVQGEAEVDESAVTGEPLARSKKAGATVLSGSVDVNGVFEMRADKVSEDSQYARMVQLVKRAQEEKAPIQRLADRYALFFTPLTLLMCAIGYFITRDPTTILAVLVVATPCPLILATPVAVISGINRAAQEGIIVKGGAPIEQIARAQVVVFDKTGTITFGMPFVEEIVPLNGTTASELLRKVGSVEQLSCHTIAQSLTKKALDQFPQLPLAQNFKEVPGRGVEGDVDGEHIAVGSQAYLEERLGKDFFKNNEHVLSAAQRKGKLVIFVSVGKIFSGVIEFADKIRPGVPGMIRELHRLGVKMTMMLTGDSEKNAELIAREAGIEQVHAHLLPEQKVEAIHALNQKYSCTVMVGDGINDAPALASATVGVAMGAHGTGITAEAADIVLLVDDVTKVADAVFIGQRMLHIAKQSIFVGIGLSFCLMIVAAFGHIEPAIGAMLQEVIDAAVILNALRAR